LIDFTTLNIIDHINKQSRSHSLESCPHGTIYSTLDCSKVKMDFSSNINPYGISKFVLREIKKNILQTSHTYPDPKCTLLKKSISEYIHCDIDQNWITVGNGATEIIHNFVRSMCSKKSIIPSPTFCEYELASKRCGMSIDYIPLSKKLHFDPDLIIEKVKKNPNSLICLCNPNNPTGLVDTNAIEKILSSIDNSKTILMIDESFIEFLSEIEKKSMISRIKEFENLTVLRSMTKSYGLAGLRLGYFIANPIITQRLKSYQIAWNVNGIAQIAGIAALNDQDYLLKTRKAIQKEREYMYSKINLKKTNVKALRSYVNFFLIKLKKVDSISYQKILLKYYGILVRDCSTFGGLSNQFIRVAVRKHEENIKLLKAIYEINTNFHKYEVY
jgi:threonine-phosphate decarboxylase